MCSGKWHKLFWTEKGDSLWKIVRGGNPGGIRRLTIPSLQFG